MKNKIILALGTLFISLFLISFISATIIGNPNLYDDFTDNSINASKWTWNNLTGGVNSIAMAREMGGQMNLTASGTTVEEVMVNLTTLGTYSNYLRWDAVTVSHSGVETAAISAVWVKNIKIVDDNTLFLHNYIAGTWELNSTNCTNHTLYINGVLNRTLTNNLCNGDIIFATEVNNIAVANHYVDNVYINKGTINLSKISPLNGTSTIDNYILLNASLNPTNMTLINVTFNVFYSNNTFFNTQTNAVTGTTLNYSTYNLTGLGVFQYKWNINSCVTLSNSTVVCVDSDENNYTFNYGANTTSITYNATSFETKYETPSINLTVPEGDTLTNAYLSYNGTDYSATTTSWGSNKYTLYKTLSVPAGSNNTFYFKWKLDGLDQNSSTYQQNVTSLIFSNCNSTYNTQFINFTFKDESSLALINATIPTSTFNYWIDNSTANKTLTYSNTSENYSFSFCTNYINGTLNVKPRIQYLGYGSGYPQRIYEPSTLSLTNTTTNTTLYLLATASGQYVTFQVVNPSTQPLSGVFVNVSRQIGGSPVLVSQGTTGDDGGITFWLSPDYEHTLYSVKSGFTTQITTITPTNTAYTIVMGGSTATQILDHTRGIIQRINPSITTTLYNDTNYNFNMTISTSYWELENFGFYIYLRNGTVLDSKSSTSSTGGTLNVLINSSNYTVLYMNYYYTINGTNTTGIAKWTVLNSLNTGWSIAYLFTDFKSYLSSGIFGLDNFGMNIIIFLMLFLTIGIFSYKYSISSPLAISVMAFICIFFFDIVLGLLTSPAGTINHVYTWLIGLITAVIIMKGVYTG